MGKRAQKRGLNLWHSGDLLAPTANPFSKLLTRKVWLEKGKLFRVRQIGRGAECGVKQLGGP